MILSDVVRVFFMTTIGEGIEGAWIRMFGGRNECAGGRNECAGGADFCGGIIVGLQMKGDKMLRQRIYRM